ncbi:MAG: gliding motility-associated C-terminal domain-containing protein, partial [Ekhidna sp.]
LSQNFEVEKLIMNSGGSLNYNGSEFIVKDEINFIDGVIFPGSDTEFIIESNATVRGGSPTSYIQGAMTHLGGGSKYFPLGYEGQFAPITLLDVAGVDQKLTASYQNPNSSTPIPGEDLLGVSHIGLWEVSLDEGSIDSALVNIDFSNEDLENFIIRNDIRHRVNSPVVAFSDSLDGTFHSLGVESLNFTDSATFGNIITEVGILPELNETLYLAIALAPRIVPEGQFYIPQAFSPRASDNDNQTFRVFGERIQETGFRLEIYNRLGILVYSTSSFEEANKTGWTGVNQRTGKEEPSGTYYYFVRLQKENEEIFEEKGALYLLR